MIAMCQVPYLQNALAGCLHRLTQTVFRVTALLFSKEMEAMTKLAGSMYAAMEPHDSKAPPQSSFCSTRLEASSPQHCFKQDVKAGLLCLLQKAETKSHLVFADPLTGEVFVANDKELLKDLGVSSVLKTSDFTIPTQQSQGDVTEPVNITPNFCKTCL